MSAIHRLTHLDSHHRLFWSLALGLAAFFLGQNRLEPATQMVVSWNVFALTDLALMWVVLIKADPVHVRKTVRLQDTGRRVIFGIVILADLAAFLAVAFVLGPARSLPRESLGIHFALSFIAIISSWMLTHTVFALRYAHLFYSGEAPEDATRRHGGLEFPGGQSPDYLDFAYFAFVIGMTFQVSDVQISSRKIRRLVLLHGLLSFAFVTVILALTISVVSSQF
jgi:uncharacterized membrane protein